MLFLTISDGYVNPSNFGFSVWKIIKKWPRIGWKWKNYSTKWTRKKITYSVLNWSITILTSTELLQTILFTSDHIPIFKTRPKPDPNPIQTRSKPDPNPTQTRSEPDFCQPDPSLLQSYFKLYLHLTIFQQTIGDNCQYYMLLFSLVSNLDICYLVPKIKKIYISKIKIKIENKTEIHDFFTSDQIYK